MNQKITEHEIQSQCVRWFKMQYKNHLLFAIPNAAKRGFAVANMMKAEGMVSGIPDLFLACPNDKYHGLFIEMKSETGKLSDNQKAVILMLQHQNYCVKICRSLDEFMIIIKEYLKH